MYSRYQCEISEVGPILVILLFYGSDQILLLLSNTANENTNSAGYQKIYISSAMAIIIEIMAQRQLKIYAFAASSSFSYFYVHSICAAFFTASSVESLFVRDYATVHSANLLL